MRLLDHYLKAVRTYLPKDAPQDDILLELRGHLQTLLEERQTAIGRTLTEREQEEVLAAHGSPIDIAGRYGSGGRGLAFGRELISPETFPLFIRIFLLNIVLTAGAHIGLPLLGGQPVRIVTFAVAVAVQFVILTVVFTVMDAMQRRPGLAGRRGMPRQSWRFPPPYLQRIPRWQSLSGGIALSIALAWWAAVPSVPVLIFGSAADRLALADSWHPFYWPVVSLLLLGIAQRVTTFVRPDWNWIQAVTRLTVNAALVALLIPFLRGHPHVTPLTPVLPESARLATRVSNMIWWYAFLGFGLYWLITAAFNAWLCASIGRYGVRVYRDRQPPAAVLPPDQSGSARNVHAFRRRAS